MSERSVINDKIVEWIENRVKTKYPDDVSMVLIYGSHINGTANAKSDVDCYFIPKTERGYHMAVDFIIEGTGYDIFPMSWERVERISDLQEVIMPCVGDVRILYCHSEEDLQRFRQLQSNLRQNLSDVDYIKKITAKKFTEACSIFSRMKISTNAVEIMKSAGNIIMILSNVIALYNHDYFHFGLKKQFEDLQSNFPDIPKDFISEYSNIVKAMDTGAYTNHSSKLLNIVGNHLNLSLQISDIIPDKVPVENKNPDYYQLAVLYEEISSTFNKIGSIIFLVGLFRSTVIPYATLDRLQKQC